MENMQIEEFQKWYELNKKWIYSSTSEQIAYFAWCAGIHKTKTGEYKKELQDKLSECFEEYANTLRDDENSLEEYYNTPRGYAIKEIKDIFTYLRFEIPKWIANYYTEEK